MYSASGSDFGGSEEEDEVNHEEVNLVVKASNANIDDIDEMILNINERVIGSTPENPKPLSEESKHFDSGFHISTTPRCDPPEEQKSIRSTKETKMGRRLYKVHLKRDDLDKFHDKKLYPPDFEVLMTLYLDHSVQSIKT